MLLWIVLAVGAHLLLAVLLKEFVTTKRLSEIRAELFREAHPGGRPLRSGLRRTLTWTDAFGLTSPEGGEPAPVGAETRSEAPRA